MNLQSIHLQPDGSTFWIGGTDGESNGKWLNMATFEEYEHINWLPGKPEDSTGRTGYCMEAVMKDGKLFANDISCDTKRHFICENIKQDK